MKYLYFLKWLNDYIRGNFSLLWDDILLNIQIIYLYRLCAEILCNATEVYAGIRMYITVWYLQASNSVYIYIIVQMVMHLGVYCCILDLRLLLDTGFTLFLYILSLDCMHHGACFLIFFFFFFVFRWSSFYVTRHLT